MDNQILDISGRDEGTLELALEIAFVEDGEVRRACGWAITKENGLLLFQSNDKKCTLFPAFLSHAQILPIVQKWLEETSYRNHTLDSRCGEVDFDGDVKAGWQVYRADNYEGVEMNYTVLCAVRPALCRYPK